MKIIQVLKQRLFRFDSCLMLRVTEDGAVIGKVIDLETNEEYLPIRLKDPHGSFSATAVRSNGISTIMS